MRQFAKQVAAHLVGWVIVRTFLDKLARAYLGTDHWEDEKKDIAVKVVAEMESIKSGEDVQLVGPAVENIARKIHAAICGHDAFVLVRRNRQGEQLLITPEAFTDACRVGFETVIAEARGEGGMETKGQWGR